MNAKSSVLLRVTGFVTRDSATVASRAMPPSERNYAALERVGRRQSEDSQPQRVGKFRRVRCKARCFDGFWETDLKLQEWIGLEPVSLNPFSHEFRFS